jgi:hypothetical protein
MIFLPCIFCWEKKHLPAFRHKAGGAVMEQLEMAVRDRFVEWAERSVPTIKQRDR